MMQFHQQLVKEWTHRSFGANQSKNLDQRALRLLEEAIELSQAVGVPKDQLHKLVDYVYARPIGAIGQEVGGVAVTLLAFCNAINKDFYVFLEQEILRVLDKPSEHFTARNAEKNAAGFHAAGITD